MDYQYPPADEPKAITLLDGDTVHFTTTNVTYSTPIVVEGNATIFLDGHSLTGESTSNGLPVLSVLPGGTLHLVANPEMWETASVLGEMTLENAGKLYLVGYLQYTEQFTLNSSGEVTIEFKPDWLTPKTDWKKFYPSAGTPDQAQFNILNGGRLTGWGVINANLQFHGKTYWDLPADKDECRNPHHGMTLSPSSSLITVTGTLGAAGCTITVTINTTSYGQLVYPGTLDISQTTLDVAFSGFSPSPPPSSDIPGTLSILEVEAFSSSKNFTAFNTSATYFSNKEAEVSGIWYYDLYNYTQP